MSAPKHTLEHPTEAARIVAAGAELVPRPMPVTDRCVDCVRLPPAQLVSCTCRYCDFTMLPTLHVLLFLTLWRYASAAAFISQSLLFESSRSSLSVMCSPSRSSGPQTEMLLMAPGSLTAHVNPQILTTTVRCQYPAVGFSRSLGDSIAEKYACIATPEVFPTSVLHALESSSFRTGEHALALENSSFRTGVLANIPHDKVLLACVTLIHLSCFTTVEYCQLCCNVGCVRGQVCHCKLGEHELDVVLVATSRFLILDSSISHNSHRRVAAACGIKCHTPKRCRLRTSTCRL